MADATFQSDAFQSDAFQGGGEVQETFAVGAWIKGTQVGSFATEAFVHVQNFDPAVFDYNVFDTAGESPTVNGSFSVSATIFGTVSHSTGKADAVVKRTQASSTTVNAVIRRTQTGTFATNAFVQPWFSVDAAIVFRPVGSTTVSATIKRTQARTFATNAFVQPWFSVDAETISNLFRVPINAAVKKTIQSSTTANADIAAVGDKRGLINVNAIIRETPVRATQTGAEVARSGIPVASISQAGAHVVWSKDSNALASQFGAEVAWAGEPNALAIQFGAEIVWRVLDGKTKVFQHGIERARTGDPTLLVSQQGLEIAHTVLGNAHVHQAGLEVAYEKPKGTFTVNSLFFRPWEYMPPVTQTIDAALVWKITGPPWTTDAFIQWYMAVDAIRFQPDNLGAFALDAALIIRQYGSFSVNAFTQGFLLNAVIKASGYGEKRGVFNVAAVKSNPRYPIDAWIVGTRKSFLVNAALKANRSGTFSVSSWKNDFAWNKYRTFTSDAVIQPEVSSTTSGEIWVEAFLAIGQRTVVFDGEGETHVERGTVTEPLLFPGFPNNPNEKPNTYLSIDNCNNLYGPFITVDGYPVTVTLYELPTWGDRSIGVHGPYQNHWAMASAPGSYEFLPADDRYASYIYTNHRGLPYDPSLAGSGFVTFTRDDVIVDAYPAPTLDAWIVGTLGEPVTIDAEIVGPTKVSGFYANAWVNDEINWHSFGIEAFVRSTRSGFIGVFSAIADRLLTVDAVIHQPHLAVDAFIQPFFIVGAALKKTITPINPVTGKGPAIDAVIVRGMKTAPFPVDAYLFPAAGWGIAFVDAAIKKTMTTTVVPGPQRFYVAAFIAHLSKSFEVGSYIGHQFKVDACIQPYFTVGAHIRGNPYIIFGSGVSSIAVTDGGSGYTSPPLITFTGGEGTGAAAHAIVEEGEVVAIIVDDPGWNYLSSPIVLIGSPGVGAGAVAYLGTVRTDPYGNPPMVGRSFRIKIEAGIPDPVPVGNDAEIERLITLILEAEAELEAMYCAVTHYSSQGAPSTSGHSNPAGTGSVKNNGSLPGVISQIGYPGAGDIDDCWLVATVWAAVAAGESYRPNARDFRRWANNPDRPGPTGGTLTHIMRGAREAWPDHRIRRYQSTNWDGFTSMLKAGWTASLAVRSSALPSNLRYGFNGRHQIGVAYQDGKYWVANPLASNGARPREISGADLRRAARGFIGGTICAALFQ